MSGYPKDEKQMAERITAAILADGTHRREFPDIIARELAPLYAENTRLREALEKVDSWIGYSPVTDGEIRMARSIVRKALQEPKT